MSRLNGTAESSNNLFLDSITLFCFFRITKASDNVAIKRDSSESSNNLFLDSLTSVFLFFFFFFLLLPHPISRLSRSERARRGRGGGGGEEVRLIIRSEKVGKEIAEGRPCAVIKHFYIILLLPIFYIYFFLPYK